VVEHRREEQALAAERVGVAADESQEARGRGGQALGQGLGVAEDRRGRRGEGPEDRDGHARRGAGGVHGHGRRPAQALDAGAVLTPRRQSLTPRLGLLLGIDRQVCTLPSSRARVEPRLQVAALDVWEGQREVAHVALRVDDEDGHAVDGCLLDEGHAQARLATARHAHYDGVGGEVGGVVEERLV
jgi:hypothetical protein